MADDITQRPECAVRGIVVPGAMCAHVIGGKSCGYDGSCRHKRTPDAPKPPAEADTLRARVAELEAEVQRLRADARDDEATRATMADLLSRTAIALRGPEPPLPRWSWHDLPDRAAAAIAAIDVVHRAAIDALQARIDAKRKEG